VRQAQSRVRSCGEKLPGGDWEEAATGGELCSGGDHRHRGPVAVCGGRRAKNESAAAGAWRLAGSIFDQKCGEIIDGGKFSETTDHEPDGGIGDPVHGKIKSAVNRPLFPAMVENDGDHGDNLHHHLENLPSSLASMVKPPEAAMERKPLTQKLAADDDDGDPRRNQARVELERVTKAAAMRSLSAMGSSRMPMVVIWPRLGGEISVNAVVMEAAINMAEGPAPLWRRVHCLKWLEDKIPDQQGMLQMRTSVMGIWQVHRAAREASGRVPELNSIISTVERNAIGRRYC